MIKDLTKWIQDRESLVLKLDINERVYNGCLLTELKIPELEMENDMSILHPHLASTTTCYM